MGGAVSRQKKYNKVADSQHQTAERRQEPMISHDEHHDFGNDNGKQASGCPFGHGSQSNSTEELHVSASHGKLQHQTSSSSISYSGKSSLRSAITNFEDYGGATTYSFMFDPSVAQKLQEMLSGERQTPRSATNLSSVQAVLKEQSQQEHIKIIISRFEKNPLPTVLCNANGQVMALNTAALSRFGTEAESLLGKDLGRCYTEAITLREICKLNRPRLIKFNQVPNVDPFEVELTAVESCGGNLITVFIKDLSNEVRVGLLQRFVRILFELCLVPIIGIDINGIIAMANQAAAKGFGYEQVTDLVSQNVKMVVPQKFAQYHDQFISNYLRTGKKHVLDVVRYEKGRMKDGSERPIELKTKEISLFGRRCFVGFVYDREAGNKDVEKQRAELADAIFPPAIVARLLQGENIHDQLTASIVFCDLVGFTNMCSSLQPAEVVQLLNDIFTAFDIELLDKFSLEKIKTIGDCYMCAAGLPNEIEDCADKAIHGALQMLEIMKRINNTYSERYGSRYGKLNCRVGIHTGEVVAGVVGKTRRLYDVWGDSVNYASRMESSGVPGEVQISCDTYDNIIDKSICSMFAERKGITVKGKGVLNTWITQISTKAEDFQASVQKLKQ